MKDPIETIVEEALTNAGIPFERGDSIYPHLDFILRDPFGGEVYIEVCAYNTDKKIQQLNRVSNAILIQGRKAALLFAGMIRVT